MSARAGGVTLLDLEPATEDFLEQAIAGLSSSPRTLPSKFFYDEHGSDLFLQICELPGILRHPDRDGDFAAIRIGNRGIDRRSMLS